MPHLVAIDLPGGEEFVVALRRAWDDGDAVFPVDARLPARARVELLAAIAPDRLVDAAGHHRLTGRGVEPGDAVVVATSGSSGPPKGVVLTHHAVQASALATSRRVGISGDDVWLACLPLAHVGGLSVVTRALITDTPLVVHPAFDPGRVEQAARDGATLVSLVGTALRRIDPRLFRMIVLGGSSPPPDRPANTIATYGLSETGSGVVYDGRPIDGVEVRLAADGEVLVRGPMLLRCYRDGSTPVDSDGWLHTGDVGCWLEDGRLHVEGRRGDLIITGGEKVWPDRVEAVLAKHPLVGDVAVAGVDDIEWGRRVVAWVVPRGPEPPSADALRAFVAEWLPGYMAPKEVRTVGAIPRTSLGKIARSSLTATD